MNAYVKGYPIKKLSSSEITISSINISRRKNRYGTFYLNERRMSVAHIECLRKILCILQLIN